jgi:23S rRNA pseudouridine955/2504/2580 synthase
VPLADRAHAPDPRPDGPRGWPLLGDGKYGSERFNRGFEEKGQALYSYRLRFDFPTDAGLLNYLRGREFKVKKVDFAEKYFGLEEV